MTFTCYFACYCDMTGSAPLLGRKRKRKPTQKILEYCLEAEASAGPKKKVEYMFVQQLINLTAFGLQ